MSFVTCDGFNASFAPADFDNHCKAIGAEINAPYDSYCDPRGFKCHGLHNRDGKTCAVDFKKDVSCCAGGADIRCDGLVSLKKQAMRKADCSA
jgi:hypothetical protein